MTDDGFRLPFMYAGQVVDREDPKLLGRVRVKIPGLVDQSGWAFPAGAPGAGSKQRGLFAVPEKDADVYVMFLMGDPDRPIYFAGHWGTGEAPTRIGTKTKSTAPKVRVLETEKFEFIIDDDSNKLIIRRKDGSGEILLGADDASQPFVKGTTFKTGMEALFDLIIAHFHSTGVGPSSPPTTAATFTTLKADIVNWLSAFIKGG